MYYVKTIVSLLLAIQPALTKDFLSFVAVGDFAEMHDMPRSELVFDAIDLLKRNATPGSKEDFDFFTTVGDNIYPMDALNPTKKEFKQMMDLFQKRESIKNLSIYPVRGNHDCYFNDQEAELKLAKEYPTWKMPSNYYEKTFDIGKNGTKLSLL